MAAGRGGGRGRRVSADLVQLRCTASRDLAARRMSARTGGASDADQAIAAPDGGRRGTVAGRDGDRHRKRRHRRLPGESSEEALQAIRPHGSEHPWRPTRPYMLPG